MKIYIVIISAVLLSSSIVSGQSTQAFEQSASILPPSPTASELGKYGQVPVGLSTGTPSVQVPLHQFSTRHLSVPIMLTYSSGGVKVDQLASWVGMNWSLEAGGVITRIVRDEADDDLFFGKYPDNFNPNNGEALVFMERCANETFFDSEPDLFTFNFAGYSGKFMYDRTGEAIIMPYQNIKIRRVLDYFTEESVFTITTPDGIAYTFSESEFSKTAAIGAECGRTYDHKRETSWFLTQIAHPAGDVIHFEYDGSHVYTYALGVTQNVTKKLARTGVVGSETQCPELSSATCVNTMNVTGGYLKRIWSTGFGEVGFTASLTRSDLDDYKLDAITVKNVDGNVLKTFSFSYTFSTATQYFNSLTTEQLKHRMFLTKVQETDASSVASKAHSFEYKDINGLPPRLSFAQDHWGYFNGKTNQYFVSALGQDIRNQYGVKVFTGISSDREPASVCDKGMLTKVIYPTGGFTSLQYEPNTYHGSNTITPAAVPLELTVQGTGFKTAVTQTLPSFISPINQTMVFQLNNNPSSVYDRR